MNMTVAELAEFIEIVRLGVTALDFRCNEFSTLPENIGDLVYLKKLNLNGNRLTSLPTSIGNLSNLTELYLNGHQLTTLPESIGNLTNLTRLDLNGDRLTSLPDSIQNLEKLTKLNLNSNCLDRVPDIIFNLAKLTEINLDGNLLTDLSNLKNIPNLKIIRSPTETKFKIVKSNDFTKIYIGDRYIETILNDLSNFTNLVALNLNSYGLAGSLGNLSIDKILADLSKLPNLTSLNWHVDLLSYLPILKTIPKLDRIGFLGIVLDRYNLFNIELLTSIRIADDRFTDLSLLQNLPNLEKVYFQWNNLPRRYWAKFSDWKPEWLLDENNKGMRFILVKKVGFDLEYLIEVVMRDRVSTANLSGLDLEKLPASIGKMSSLQELNLSHNKLKNLPNSISNLCNLTRLDLLWNQLTSLPESIGNLKNLTKLSLSFNKLVELPDNIGHMTKLTSLSLGCNRLKSIPYTIDYLINLLELNLSNNQLKILPNSIGSLPQLASLDLSNNQLTELTDRMSNLNKLTSIDLNGNPLTDLSMFKNLPNLKRLTFFGVDMPRRYWTKFSEWKPEWLLDENNAEIRRALIDRVGYEKICQALKAVKLDTWREYTLLKIDNIEPVYNNGWNPIGREPIVLLKMTCPSTHHVHILRVPPEMSNAEAAIVWVNHGIHPDDFAVQT
jgi:leucine-rich repeat protein SHOC2